MQEVQSPVTGLDNVILERRIEAKDIIDFYLKWPGINVQKYMGTVEFIDLYRCQSSGYRFYYPFSLAGDEEFYQELQTFPWYYVEEKWEHDMALEMIQPHDLVLEVGCGSGAFLQRLSSEVGAQGIGLELNQHAVNIAKGRDLEVYPELLEDHMPLNEEKYDVVCSFQVLEHVSNVKEFLDMKLSVLKPGGKLIIAVPNNGSFMRHLHGWSTNMPPHHLGLWNKESLVNLQKFFPLKIRKIYYEPLTQFGAYHQIQVDRLTKRIPFIKIRDLVRRTLNVKPIQSLSTHSLKYLSSLIPDHTILVEYVKVS